MLNDDTIGYVSVKNKKTKNWFTKDLGLVPTEESPTFAIS